MDKKNMTESNKNNKIEYTLEENIGKSQVSLTYDDILQQKKIDVSVDDLVNKNIWNEKFFEKILYEKLKENHIEDKNLLKEKYISWHKGLLESIINPETKNFENTNFTNALKVLNIHPCLTRKDKKNLDLIKSQIKDSYRKQYLLNSFLGFSIIIYVIRRNNPGVEFRKLIIQNKIRILAYNMIIFFAFDAFFNSYYKLRLLNQYSKEYKLTDKYISGYI